MYNACILTCYFFPRFEKGICNLVSTISFGRSFGIIIILSIRYSNIIYFVVLTICIFFIFLLCIFLRVNGIEQNIIKNYLRTMNGPVDFFFA